MEVNERVITMLLSSAVGKVMVHSQVFANSDCNAQVIPRVATLYLWRSSSAARKASDVRPEREIMTAWRSGSASCADCENSSTSEAGKARAGWPVSCDQLPAAASAR